MYLKFTTELECQNAITEINARMGLSGNITTVFAEPRQDTDGNYVIPKPKQSVLNEIKLLVRDVQVMGEDEQGNPALYDSIEIVNKTFDELGNDITVYDGTERELIKQVNFNTLFTYVEVESVEFPAAVNEEV